MKKKVNDYNHNKYITASEFNNLTRKNFATGLVLN